jgi:adenosylcobinamide-phosphate guanylyltransferase
MCGGRGTRLGDGEKPLQAVDGVTLLDRVRAALTASRVETVFSVTAPDAPETAARVGNPVIEAPGDGYVPDLQMALADERIEQPVLTVAADLPLLDGEALDAVLAAAGGQTLTVAVPAGRVRALGFSVDTTLRTGGVAVRPAGVNVVGRDPERLWRTRDPRFAANVNRPRDLTSAEWHLAAED